MSRALTVVLTLLVASILAPLAVAQEPLPAMVDGCAKQCGPKDADVNGDAVKTGDEKVAVILYGHFEDILNQAPLNTQRPCLAPCTVPEDDLNRGFLTPVVSTRAHPDYDLRFENNWFKMFSSAGYVEIGPDGEWRTHQEPGLAEEVTIVGDKITLYFYLSAYPVPNGDSTTSPTQNQVLAVMPQVGVYARMETGRHEFNGEVIAQGDTASDDAAGLAGSQSRVNIISTPGGPDIYEFAVPMKVERNTIPDVRSGIQGFIVSINPYQIKGKQGSAIEDYQFMQSDWRVRVGPSTPPRLVFDVEKSMMTKAASLSIFNNLMFIRWSFVSPWGSYDIDEPSLRVKLNGPTSPDPGKVGLSRPSIVKRSVDHDAHFKPVNATWKFDYQKAGLADGKYTFDLEVLNLQQTYKLTQQLEFTMKGGVPQDLQIIGAPPPNVGQAQQAKGDSPGLAGIAAIAALAVAAIVNVRRRQV